MGAYGWVTTAWSRRRLVDRMVSSRTVQAGSSYQSILMNLWCMSRYLRHQCHLCPNRVLRSPARTPKSLYRGLFEFKTRDLYTIKRLIARTNNISIPINVSSLSYIELPKPSIPISIPTTLTIQNGIPTTTKNNSPSSHSLRTQNTSQHHTTFHHPPSTPSPNPITQIKHQQAPTPQAHTSCPTCSFDPSARTSAAAHPPTPWA